MPPAIRCDLLRSNNFIAPTGLPAKAIQRLAEADAFGSFDSKKPARSRFGRSLVLKDEQMPLFDERIC